MMAGLAWFMVVHVHAAGPEKAGMARLQLVDQKQHSMAACLDGSAPAFYFRPATSESARGKYVVYHEGGDFCGYGDTWDEWIEDCRKRSHTELGSSRNLRANQTLNLFKHGVDAFANDNTSLTFEWNWVYMMYCDGHYYAGANTSTTLAPHKKKNEELYFRGAFNVEAILSTLGLTKKVHAASPSMAVKVTDVLVHGCSSGGVAVFSNADHIRSLIPSTIRVAAAANSGYYMNTEEIYTEYWTRPPFLMANLSGTLNTGCVAAQPAAPWNCIVAEVTAPYVMTMPIFAWQSRFDSNQLSCVQIDPNDNAAVNAYGFLLDTSLKQWVANATSSVPRGAFVDGCYRHCGCSNSISQKEWTPRSALSSWWAGLWPAGAQPNRSSSMFWSQDGTYPCTTCCPSAKSVCA
jgi:hypothetical protein